MSGPMTEPREPRTEVRDALICPDCGVTYKQLVAMCHRHIRPRSEGPGLDALREALAALLDKLDEYLPFEGEEGVMLRYADVLGALLAAGVHLGDEELREAAQALVDWYDGPPYIYVEHEMEERIDAIRAALAAQEDPISVQPPICKAKHTHCWEHRAASRRLAQEGETPK